MMKQSGIIIYSPTDLIRYLASPFASWLDRYYLENPDAIAPDRQTEEEELLSRTGDKHEQLVLSGYKASTSVIEIAKDNFATAHAATLAAIKDKAPIIYQAALQDGVFAGYADFLELDTSGKYLKLARRPRSLAASLAALPSMSLIPPAPFSLRCSTDDVPGMSRICRE